MNIICRKTKCKYNKNFVCYAKGIDVSKNSLCETFCECEKSPPDTSKKMLKKSPKYNPYRSTGNLKICCKADCQFNECLHCHANGITVNSLEETPYCVTYFRRIKK